MEPDPLANEQVAVAVEAVAERTDGCVTVAVAFLVHPFASVIVTV